MSVFDPSRVKPFAGFGLCTPNEATCLSDDYCVQGMIQNFKLGGALRTIALSGASRENFGGISFEKSRFYAKISYFISNFRGGGGGVAPGAV